MPLLEAVIFSCLWAFGLGQVKLEQPEISISRARYKSAHILCKVSTKDFTNAVIHWYRQKPHQEIEHLTYVLSSYTQVSLGGKKNKLEATKNAITSTSTLKVNFLEQEDEAMYYCACWALTNVLTVWVKRFAQGTKLIVTPPDRNLDAAIFPKPTIFFPSIDERRLHKSGTYLCLLEDFFPDVIKIDWKEKDDETILTSQQGDTMKTNDTYMKFSWLTVTEASVDKEHKCIVKHEMNKGKAVQEILFSSHIKELSAITSRKASLKDETDNLQVQLMNTSAYYTYLLLLFKNLIYFTIILFYLLGIPALCGNGKSSSTWWHHVSTCLHWLLLPKASSEYIMGHSGFGLFQFTCVFLLCHYCRMILQTIGQAEKFTLQQEQLLP
ncbi:LOW QUALITY PROTEIN: immunoglobulin kappa light chain-like [Lontra canadensis]|uniref:LOW QUALITY PROTEIN: immunoglobulin kappa light chain-like n=1 Tax=Lontra canadensis TaxID=76717 RepID=UPI0013F2E6D2|nr:LOW QUALITY PROTEIN: immunoglobulin kappa light chain-like [Lontra canadensis]